MEITTMAEKLKAVPRKIELLLGKLATGGKKPGITFGNRPVAPLEATGRYVDAAGAEPLDKKSKPAAPEANSDESED